MGATVLGCGHSHHLFQMEYFTASPQVHLHFLTDDAEFEANGFGRLEVVCHGCGASLLLFYDEQGSKRQHLGIRNKFHDKHRTCPNRGYESKCPDYRSSYETVDTRRLKLVKTRRAG